MLRLMQKASREMSIHMKDHSVLKGKRAEKTARELLVFSELCRRLADDDVYYEEPYFKHSKGKMYKTVRYRYNYDLEYLRRILKHLPHWWD